MENLAKELKARFEGAKRVAVLGIGSELRGDDAAGMLVAESIAKSKKKMPRGTALRAFAGSTAPENLTGEIRKFRPEHLVMVDTAEMKRKPGTVILLSPEAVGAGVSFSTHKLPAEILIDYFIKSLKCKVTMIGIQPKSIKFGQDVSGEIKKCAKEVSGAIMRGIA